LFEILVYNNTKIISKYIIIFFFKYSSARKKIRNIIKTALNHNPSTEMKTATQSGSNEIKKEKLKKKKEEV